MTEQPDRTLDSVEERFPEAVSRDERQGYEGYVVAPESLLTFAEDAAR